MTVVIFGKRQMLQRGCTQAVKSHTAWGLRRRAIFSWKERTFWLCSSSNERSRLCSVCMKLLRAWNQRKLYPLSSHWATMMHYHNIYLNMRVQGRAECTRQHILGPDLLSQVHLISLLWGVKGLLCTLKSPFSISNFVQKWHAILNAKSGKKEHDNLKGIEKKPDHPRAIIKANHILLQEELQFNDHTVSP